MRLFGRRATVSIDGVQTTDLRIAFRVSKDLGKEPNTAEVSIYNLSATTRGRMTKGAARVVISAGYEGTEAVIFTGDARRVEHRNEGVDWITRASCGDGERAYRFARASESFAPGAKLADVARYLAKQLGINEGNLGEQLERGGFRGALDTFAKGFTTHGRASAELDKVLRSAGLSWSVQDGALQVLRDGEAARGTAHVLSAETGLVGIPELGAPDEKGGPPVLRCTSLLQPTIRCGGAIELRAQALSGRFRVSKLEHRGDTHAGDWYTAIEARPL